MYHQNLAHDCVVTPPVPSLSVMIVDDNAFDRARLMRTCQKTGVCFDFHQAESGESALPVLQENKVDIVLMDYLMPGKSGLITAQQIFDRISAKQLCIILVTGYQNEGLEQEAQAAGCRQCLKKSEISVDMMRRLFLDSSTAPDTDTTTPHFRSVRSAQAPQLSLSTDLPESSVRATDARFMSKQFGNKARFRPMIHLPSDEFVFH